MAEGSSGTSSRWQLPPSPHWASPAAQPFLSAYDRGILSLFTADEEVASERELLKSVEDGPYMQEVKYIIIHCSATRENRDFTVEDLLRCHRQRKFRTIGYHLDIRRLFGHHHPAPQAEGSGRALPPLEPLLHRHLL